MDSSSLRESARRLWHWAEGWWMDALIQVFESRGTLSPAGTLSRDVPLASGAGPGQVGRALGTALILMML
jgi:hypothetical protein